MELHGLNMVFKLPPYEPSTIGFGADDAAFLARNGFTVVRLGVIYGAVEPAPGVYDDAYLDNIAATVDQLGAQGIYTLLDFHQDQYNERFHGEGFPDWAVQDDGLPNTPDRGFPGNYTAMPALEHAFDHLWANSPGPGGVGLQERYAAAWAHVAARFAGDDHVIGYDLFNEPWPGSSWPSCITSSGCPAFEAQLGALESKVIAAIRGVDPQHLVWYEPDGSFNLGQAETQLPDFGDSAAGMSFHDYCSSTVAAACRAPEQAVIANALKRSKKTGDALFLTEFGATADTGTLTRVAGDADAARLPWIEWAYCGCSDPTTAAIPASKQALVLDPAQSPQGQNVVKRTLKALARPYPLSVAGTPAGFGFNARKRVFHLSYSTVRAGARKRFRAGSCSAVILPAVQYPHGYTVRVRGARVISRRGSGTLELASRARAKKVTVTVRPAKRGRTSAPKLTSICPAG
jgi:endoglycosylceramidase